MLLESIYMLIGVLITGFGIFIMLPNVYPFFVIIISAREHGMHSSIDMARLKRIHGIDKLCFLLSRKKIKPVPLDTVKILAGSRKGGLVIMYSPKRDQYFATKFEPKTNEIAVIDEDQRLVSQISQEQDFERFNRESWLQRNQAILMSGMVFILLALIVIFGGQYLTDIAQSSSSNMAAQNDFNNQILDILDIRLGGGTPTPVGPTPP